MADKRFVLVTTDKRGVFAGYLESQDDDRIVLAQGQNCLFWSTATHGVFGLAAVGPQEGSRVGPPVSRLELVGVTAIADCSDAARETWQSQPWS